jgi:hypothetical protein
MTKGITLKTKVRFGTGQRSRKELQTGEEPEAPPPRVPRIAKLMALAIRFEQMVRDGEVTDYADLARLGHVTRARMTQIMNLLNLAPDIQERLLFLPQVESGKDAITERQVRGVAAEADWCQQRCSKVPHS